MKLDVSFNVVEPIVLHHCPDHPFAPAWCTMYLEQHDIEEPSREDIEAAIRAYRRRIGENQ